MDESELKNCLSDILHQGFMSWETVDLRMNQLIELKNKFQSLKEKNAFKNLQRLTKAINNPRRLEILRLIQEGIKCPCELEFTMDLSQATISRHLTLLEDGGLIARKREGKWSFIDLTLTPISRELLMYLAEIPLTSVKD